MEVLGVVNTFSLGRLPFQLAQHMVNAALVLAINIIMCYKMKILHTYNIKTMNLAILCLKTKMDIISTKLGSENLQEDYWDTEIHGLPLEAGLGWGVCCLCTLTFK